MAVAPAANYDYLIKLLLIGDSGMFSQCLILIVHVFVRCDLITYRDIMITHNSDVILLNVLPVFNSFCCNLVGSPWICHLSVLVK